MTFDRAHRDVRCHNVTWKQTVNAAGFSEEVTRLVVTRVELPADVRQTLLNFLDVLRQLPAWRLDEEAIPRDEETKAHLATFYTAFQAYTAWSNTNEDTVLGSTLGALIQVVFKLYWKRPLSSSTVANEAGRWVYTWSTDTGTVTEREVEEIEIRYRLADRTSPPSSNLRLAFEAVWHTGDFRGAVRLLHRKEP